MSKPKKVWIPKKQQSAETHADINVEIAHTQKAVMSETNNGKQPTPIVEDWTVVQGKKISDGHTSHAKKVSSPMPMTGLVGNEDTNRFHSLSNLDGDSNAFVDEISATTALVFKGTEAGPRQSKPGEQHKHPSFSHQRDKSVLVRPPSSVSRQK